MKTEWIKINHEEKGRNKTKPPLHENVLLANNVSKNKNDHWVVAGYRSKKDHYWNQFHDKYSDAEIFPSHWAPLPEPPTE